MRKRSLSPIGHSVLAMNRRAEKLNFGGRHYFSRMGGRRRNPFLPAAGPTGCPSGYWWDGTMCVYEGYQPKPTDAYDGGSYYGDMMEVIEGWDGQLYDLQMAGMMDPQNFAGKTPVLVRRGTPVMQMNTAMATPPIVRNPITQAANPHTVVPPPRPYSQYDLANADQFDITITKTIVNAGIAADVPFVLFSPVFLQSDYTDLIPTVGLPAGTTITVTELGNGDVTFTYANGADSVILTISSRTTPYRSILEALITDRMNIVKTRETISDNSILAQVALPIEIINGSLFGGASENSVSAVAAKSPYQEQDGIIDFDSIYPLDKYRAVRGFIAQSAPDAFSITMSFWAKRVIKP